MTNLILRKDYKPLSFAIPNTKLLFSLHPHKTIVKSHLNFEIFDLSKPINLDGEDLITNKVSIDGKVLIADKDYKIINTHRGQSLEFMPPSKSFALTCETQIAPEANTKLMGLYRSNAMYCTQCEAEGFRRITWFADRPDLLSVFEVTIQAPKDQAPILLSNGNKISSCDLDEGWHQAVYHDPHYKPCYLFALVAGNLHCLKDEFTTKQGVNVDLFVWLQDAKIERAKHAMWALKTSMRFDEDVYDLCYDLDQFHIVAVDDFNFGAMENKSLNIFNANYVLADETIATDGDYQTIESIVAHEYFHNWTGNRVTLRDWFQLSLKEGLTVFRDQSFSSDLHDETVERIGQVTALRNRQFGEDNGPLAHPVRPDSYQRIENFYTATIYEKGAELIRMLYHLVGKAGYFKGIKLYFERHDGKAATCDDFIKAMADANDMDLDQFSLWYSQIGTPTIHAKWHVKENIGHLELTQTTPKMPDDAKNDALLVPLKMGLVDDEGQSIPLKWRYQGGEDWRDDGDEMAFHFKTKQTNLEFQLNDYSQNKIVPSKNVPAKIVPSINRGFSAPIYLKFKDDIQDTIHLAKYDTDDFNRYEALQSLYHRAILQDDVAISDVIQVLKLVLKLADDKPAMVAKMFSLPLFLELFSSSKNIDVDVIDDKRKYLKHEIAEALYDDFHMLFHKFYITKKTYDSTLVGKRQIATMALSYIASIGQEDDLKLLLNSYQRSVNITDIINQFSLITQYGTPEMIEEESINFRKKYGHERILMDKWFRIQAGIQDGATKRIKKLAQDKDFSKTNPNRVRALYGGFAYGNPTQFHRLDGSGYHIITQAIIEQDGLNPMVSSSMAEIFDKWRDFEVNRQGLMKTALDEIAGHKISPQLSEIIEKIRQEN